MPSRWRTAEPYQVASAAGASLRAVVAARCYRRYGRQAEALAVYRQAHTLLADDYLGLEPGKAAAGA